MSGKRRAARITFGAVLLLLLLSLAVYWASRGTAAPVLSIADAGGEGEIAVPVTLSSLGDAAYPAASAEILFDNSRLRFLGVEPGEVTVATEDGRRPPVWRVNPERCNRTGRIALLYFDADASLPFDAESVPYENAVLFTLRFAAVPGQTGGSALSFSDAVFAASDEERSLSMADGSLKTKDGTVVVGEGAG